MSHDDFDFEPIRGLPALLPAGERLLWQSSPDWRSLAVRAFHVRKVALYFGVLLAWRVAVGIGEGHAAGAILASCGMLTGLGIAAIGVLSLLAYLSARSTVYSITTKRVLLRHGAAVPLTLNVPFKVIENAAVKLCAGGNGDISLQTVRAQRVGYIISWPYVRPGRYTRPEPCLRAVGDASAVATLLCNALAAAAGTDPVRVAAPAALDADRAAGRGVSRGPRTAAVA